MGVYAGPADWWTDGTNEGSTHIATKGVVQDGLVLNLDAGVSTSYPGSGTTWTDLSGSGRNGTLTGGPTYSSDDGGALVFDGTDDYVSFSTINALEFTYEAWIYHTPSNTANDYGYFFSNGTFGLAVSEGGNVSFPVGTVYNYNGGSSTILDTLPSNQWVHFVAVFDGSSPFGPTDFITIYKNGSFSSTKNSVFNLQSAISELFRYQANTTHYLNGKVSSVRIYNDQLTAAEITQNYNATKGRYGL